MRIFETRHGQVAPEEYYGADPSLPVGDVALTPLGKEQARLAGERLKELDFHGVIFSSPYDRTLKTASIIAEELDTSVIPLACLHEIVSRVDEDFCGATAEQIKRNYPRVQADFELPPCWWGDRVEQLMDVFERVKNGLEPVLAAVPQDCDVLLVGHAATSVALRHLFGCTDRCDCFHWNCHLSLLSSPTGECYANDCAHLPEEMWTGNALAYLEQKKKVEQSIQNVLSFFRENPGERVLHIGDTHTTNYGYYKILIEQLKPDVIIHTGDLADELKAGRIESAREPWRVAAKTILKMMEQSGARVIIVPGNNDLEEEVKAFAPNAQVVQRNTVMEFSGKKVLLCHELNRMDENAEADVFLYGHGLTGETRTASDNIRGTRQFFNAVWGVSVHVFGKDAHRIVPCVNI